MSSCVILFSGGSDSLCAAALCAQKYQDIHLLTFYEKATQGSPMPHVNILRLKSKYPQISFKHSIINIDPILKELSYENYWYNIKKYGLLNLATPGLSSLAWHISAIIYCNKNLIFNVYDGITKELLHLPGHMPEVRELFSELYQGYKMSFSSPVIEWEVPEDQRFTEKLIVDRHGFVFSKDNKKRTTGAWLFEQELLPATDIKGSLFDRNNQHDCYPFVVYNMLVFWFFENAYGYDFFKLKLLQFMKSKITTSKKKWLSDV